MTSDGLRAATPVDAPAMAAIYGPYVTGTAISFEEVPPTGESMAARMAAHQLPWWVAVDQGAVVGYVYASPHRSRPAYRWSVEVSAYLAPSYHGRGLATRLYERLLDDLRELGYVSAYAGITLPNPASVRLHERVGFKPVGVFGNAGYKHGQWHDVGWWQASLCAPPSSEPADPRSWSPTNP